MNAKIILAKVKNLVVFNDKIENFKTLGYEIICQNDIIKSKLLLDLNITEFFRKYSKLRFMSRLDRDFHVISVMQEHGLEISDFSLNKTREYIDNYCFLKHEAFDVYCDIARLYIKNIKMKGFVDFYANFDEVLDKVAMSIEKSDEKFCFFGIDFQGKVLFNFFKKIARCQNVTIILTSNIFSEQDFIASAIGFCYENFIEIENFSDNNQDIANIFARKVDGKAQICEILTREISKFGKIGIISKNQDLIETLGNFLYKKNISVFFEKKEISKKSICVNFLEMIKNDIFFADYFIDFIEIFIKTKGIFVSQSLLKFKENIKNKNLIFSDEILKFASNFFQGNQEVMKLILCIENFYQSRKIEILIEFCKANFNDNFDFLNKFYPKNIDEFLCYFQNFSSQNSNEELAVKTKFSEDFNVYILTPQNAKLLNFDKVFFISQNFNENYKSNEIKTLEKHRYFADLVGFLNGSNELEFLYENDLDFIEVEAFFSIKLGQKIEKKDINFDKKRYSKKDANITSGLVNIEDLPRDFSYQKLKTYIDNPYVFFMKYILSIKQNLIGAELKTESGNALHGILSVLSKYFVSLDSLKNITNEWVKNEIMPGIYEKITDDFIRINLELELDEFLNLIRDVFLRIFKKNGKIESEKSFFYDLVVSDVQIKISAKPDLIAVYEDGSYEIFDLKTGNNDHVDKTIANEMKMKSPQMLMYALVMQKNGFKIKDFSYIYFSKNAIKSENFLEKSTTDLQDCIDKFEVFFIEKLSEIYKKNGTIFIYGQLGKYDDILYFSKYD